MNMKESFLRTVSTDYVRFMQNSTKDGKAWGLVAGLFHLAALAGSVAGGVVAAYLFNSVTGINPSPGVVMGTVGGFTATYEIGLASFAVLKGKTLRRNTQAS